MVALGAGANADTINVAVAANFAATLEKSRPDFEATTGHRLNIISGSSGRHYAQIVNGAPFDVFLSADSERPEALEREGVVTNDQRRVYALGRLAAWSRDLALLSSMESLVNLPPGVRIAIANPRLAPYGQAAVETLRGFGIYERLKNQLVMGENVSQVFQFAYSGSAAIGLVAYSQVLVAPVAGSYLVIPDSAYAPIVQEMVLLRQTPANRELFEYLSSEAMQPLLEAAGYFAPSNAKIRLEQ